MARDGHEFACYLAKPEGRARGAIVIVQEIFGVNEHIRALVELYAAAGYLSIAPALFDRIGRNIELDYTPDQAALGRGYMLQIERADALKDIAAAIAVVRHAGRVGVIGFCWGGQLAWFAASRLGVDAAVSYYGTRLWEAVDQLPTVPMMLHFGEQDAHTSPEQLAAIRSAFPAGIYHLDPAGHGFNCAVRPSYHPPSAQLAGERTAQFIAQHVG
jgi:carboxymethylenebutenolidase